MPPADAQPMGQQQADGLRHEWQMLLKMGYASQWTPAQKMARQHEIEALLLQAGEALPVALTRQDLLGCVPVHTTGSGLHYVDSAEILQLWREGFWAALYGAQCPLIPGVERAAYAWDWEGYACGKHLAEPAVMRALHRLADYPVLSALAAQYTQASQLDGRA